VTLRTLAAALLALALSGCALLRSLAGAAFDPPRLTYESWSAEDVGLDGVTVLLKYRVENPNAQGFRLSKVAWALDLDGKPAAKGDMPSGLSVPAKGAAPLALPVRIRWRDLPDVAALLLRDEVGFKVSGSAALASPIGDVDLPFSREGRLKVPKAPGIAVDGIRIRELTLTRLALDLRLRLTNSNAFPLPVGALAYGLRLGGEELGAGQGHPLAAVPPGGTATVTVPVRLSLAGASGAVRRLLDGGGAPLEVDGKAEFEGMQFPFEAEKPIER
jgi:LEA14-like dessication related protein